eukprot:4793623-Prorocentrum_lima.AAC.1
MRPAFNSSKCASSEKVIWRKSRGDNLPSAAWTMAWRIWSTGLVESSFCISRTVGYLSMNQVGSMSAAASMVRRSSKKFSSA